MEEAFSEFSDADAKEIDAPPLKWTDEQLVYELCKDDITKREWILDNVTHAIARKWLLHRRYSEYAQRKASE